MRWLKQIIIGLCALQLLLAPDVCLMLCCHTSAAVADESALPPCHRHARAKQPTQSDSAWTTPCAHMHDEKLIAWQRVNDETPSVVYRAVATARHTWGASTFTHNQNLRSVEATTSPPFRARSLPLRI